MPEKPQPNRRRLSGRPDPPPAPLPSSSSKNAHDPRDGKNVDQDLFNNLVEMVPLVESLMDQRANPSFKRRASVVYTPALKVPNPKGKKTAEPVSAIKQKDDGGDASNGYAHNHNRAADNFKMFSSSDLREDTKKEMEELTMLREQLDDLHKMLAEKDEALKSVEESMNQTNLVYRTVDELKRKVLEMEILANSTKSQLSNAEIKLAEKQEALEQLELETRTSGERTQELQGGLDSMELERFAFMLLFQELSENDSSAYSEENITWFPHSDHLSPVDNITESEINYMEAARVAYLASISVAKENPSIQSLAAVAEARKKLVAFVL